MGRGVKYFHKKDNLIWEQKMNKADTTDTFYSSLAIKNSELNLYWMTKPVKYY